MWLRLDLQFSHPSSLREDSIVRTDRPIQSKGLGGMCIVDPQTSEIRRATWVDRVQIDSTIHSVFCPTFVTCCIFGSPFMAAPGQASELRDAVWNHEVPVEIPSSFVSFVVHNELEGSICPLRIVVLGFNLKE